MSFDEHVSVTITVDSVGVARAGFGVPLILSANAAFAERSRVYTSIAGVAADFATTTSPEYLAAAAIFGQNPRPTKLRIGRAVGAPTQRYSMSVATVRNSHTYTLYVKGQGVTATTVTFTSDASATDGEIAAGLVSALNAVVGKNFTAAGATSPFTATGDATGNWFSIESADITDVSIVQNHAEPATTLATDLDAILLENADWYGLYTLYNSTAYVAAAAAWAETNKKLYVPDVNDSSALTVAEGSGTDVLDDIDEANYTYTAGTYYREPYNQFGARVLGRFLAKDPGSITMAYKTLAGAVADSTLTDTHRSNLEARQASYYKDLNGGFFWDGKVGDASIKFMDNRRDLDKVVNEIQVSVFQVLAANDKVPFTDAGIAMVEGAVRGALKRCARLGIVDESTIVVTVPLVADVSAQDKSDRILPDVKFSFTLQGAIHTVEVTGVVSV